MILKKVFSFHEHHALNTPLTPFYSHAWLSSNSEMYGLKASGLTSGLIVTVETDQIDHMFFFSMKVLLDA